MNLPVGPGLELAIDFHDYEEGYQGLKRLMLITDWWSGYTWDYYTTDKTHPHIVTALKHLLKMLEGYGIQP